MLIYNSKKEFLGIDEHDLKLLGFETLSDLRAEAADFADMFVRIPGYIHNFEYLHWIDYIVYGGTTNPKAVITAKGKHYQCNLSISTIYLSDAAASKAYLINLQNVRELTQSEVDEISEDLARKPKPATVPRVAAPAIDYDAEEAIRQSIIEQNNLMNGIVAPTQEQLVQQQQVEPTPKIEEPTPPTQKVVETSKKEEPRTASLEVQQEVKKEVEPSKDGVQEDDLGFDPNYVFNPQVASDELGLPLDLIEEFIEDFIAQAKEFREDLYKYLEEEDLNNLRILAHKLKGVAANLRVEDAFAVLSTINTATDWQVIRKNLNVFYKIIAKLDGEEIDLEHIEEAPEVEDDMLVLDFKDDDDIKEQPTLETPSSPELSLDDEDDLKLEIALDDQPKKEAQIEFDRAAAAQEIGIDLETYNELFEDYITDALELCSSIKEHIKQDDSTQWNQEVIQLKGMSDNMRVKLFTQELEVLLESSRQDEAHKAIDNIISIISQMKV